MALPRPWTDADSDALKAAHAEGLSLHAAATRLGRSKGITSRYAANLGLTWDRTRTAAAAQARVIDGKARRALLQVALLEDAEKLRAQLWAPCLVHSFGGRDNTYAEHTLDQPPFADQLKIVQAVGTAIEKSLRLADYDSAGGDHARGLLTAMARQLGLDDTAT